MDAENEKLKLQLLESEQTIKELREQIESHRKNWVLYLFDIFEREFLEYHTIFNPHPKDVKASYNNKTLIYSLKPTDIVCIISDGKQKNIYLKSEIANTGGELHKTNKIIVNRNDLTLPDFRYELDSLSYHLVQISRSVIVNLDCYHQNKKKLQLLLDTKYNECKVFPIGENFMDDYKIKKESFEDAVSLQRLNARYKVKKMDV